MKLPSLFPNDSTDLRYIDIINKVYYGGRLSEYYSAIRITHSGGFNPVQLSFVLVASREFCLHFKQVDRVSLQGLFHRSIVDQGP